MKTSIKRSLAMAIGATVLAGGLAGCGHLGHHDRSGPGYGHGYGYGYGAMGAHDRGERREQMVDRVASRLGLDGAQKARLATLFERLSEERAALMGASQDPRTELRALVAGERFDTSRAQALVTEKIEIVRAESPKVIAAAADFYDNLNPAQQAQVREYMELRRGWRR